MTLVLNRRKQQQQSHNHNNSDNNNNNATSTYEKLIGNTPLVKLDRLSKIVGRDIFVKMESLNPGGTGKDRAALCMIQQAEESGKLPSPVTTNNNNISLSTTTSNKNIPSSITTDETDNASSSSSSSSSLLESIINKAMKHSRSGGLVVEGTSGSTGISLATLCAARGHACIVILPDDQAPEKRTILEVLGATVRVVPTAAISNPQHYVKLAQKLAQLAQGQGIAAVFIDQFENLSNFRVHYDRTGPELWRECPQLNAFCMSSGTGGTLGGVAHFLKDRKPSCRIVLVDPPGSALFHAVQHGIAYAPQQRERALKRHRYDTLAEGIGLDRLTLNFTKGMDCMDTAIRVTDQEAVDMAHYLLKTEGLWVGSSSAMNLVGAVRTALDLPKGSTVVTVVCDAGSRHVTRFWNRKFITEWGLEWPGDDAERIPECLKEVMSS